MNLTIPPGPDDHSLGPDDAPITIVEYGRYDCPHCRQALAHLVTVRKTLGFPV
jgi:NhaA family Na+:H+ antiporter